LSKEEGDQLVLKDHLNLVAKEHVRQQHMVVMGMVVMEHRQEVKDQK
jgi:hypothetical protein